MNWYDNAIIYHIYPLGFCGAPKFNDFSDEISFRLDKVLDWIPHFKEMNVDALYLGPVFESVEHGYDIVDFKKIDRRLGDNNSFRFICDRLHENGIKVILDGVFNHVGRKFPQFVDIQEKGQGSSYCNWFQNLNFGGQSPCGDPFWYEGWNGHYNLVKLNLRNSGVCDYIMDAVNYWIDSFGIDGIRFDAADCIDFDFFKRIRSFCKSKKNDFWLMGEIIHGDYNRWANPEMLDGVTNYECYKGLYSSHNDKNYFEIDYSINRQSGTNGGIYKNISLYNFVDNHDVNRLASTISNPAYLPLIYTLEYTMPGIPSIYYGSEYGIQGRKENNSDDNLRPCLHLADMERENNELYKHIVKLGRIYRSYPALRTGSYERIQISNQQLLFKKVQGDQTVYVALNLSESPYEFSFSTHLPALVDVLSATQIDVKNGEAKVMLQPFTSMIIVADDIVNSGSETSSSQEAPSQTETDVEIGAHYRHYKGNEYEVIAVARHSENNEELIIYKSIRNGCVWARPKAIFCGKAGDGTISRFTKL
ncbi:MAG: DUF1653 domain-containing protein [Ruminococcus sp.]|nr:DUF1653 domain-containing protein [Ruminococcus sp.]